MRNWLILGMMATALACSSNDDGNDQQDGDSDKAGDSDQSANYPATCDGLYDYVDTCYSDAGCQEAFVKENLIDTCEGAGLTSSDIRERYTEGCTESIRFFCTLAVIQSNEEFFALQCCQDVYKCKQGQVCEPLENAGVCVTADSAFPQGAKSCRSGSDCSLGYKCVQGESSSKCVQICYPE